MEQDCTNVPILEGVSVDGEKTKKRQRKKVAIAGDPDSELNKASAK